MRALILTKFANLEKYELTASARGGGGTHASQHTHAPHLQKWDTERQKRDDDNRK